MSEVEPPHPCPPTYRDADTCAECWEAFGGFGSIIWLDRFLHRRRWGHNPVPLYQPISAFEMHARNIKGAQERKARLRVRDENKCICLRILTEDFRPPQRSNDPSCPLHGMST